MIKLCLLSVMGKCRRSLESISGITGAQVTSLLRAKSKFRSLIKMAFMSSLPTPKSPFSSLRFIKRFNFIKALLVQSFYWYF